MVLVGASTVHGMSRAVRAKFALHAALRASSCLSDLDTLVWSAAGVCGNSCAQPAASSRPDTLARVIGHERTTCFALRTDSHRHTATR